MNRGYAAFYAQPMTFIPPEELFDQIKKEYPSAQKMLYLPTKPDIQLIIQFPKNEAGRVDSSKLQHFLNGNTLKASNFDVCAILIKNPMLLVEKLFKISCFSLDSLKYLLRECEKTLKPFNKNNYIEMQEMGETQEVRRLMRL